MSRFEYPQAHVPVAARARYPSVSARKTDASRSARKRSLGAGVLALLLALSVLLQGCVAPTTTSTSTNSAAATTSSDDRLAQPLAPPGDVQRGKRLVLEREKGHCVLCHALPEPEAKFAGNLGPPLHGVGGRLDVAQLRARLVDASRQNPATIMPAYFRTQGLNRVASAYVGKPILTAQEIEDVVAYLVSLK